MDSTHQIFHFHGDTADSHAGSNIKKLGDINNDDFDDFSVSSHNPLGTYIFLGGNPIDNLPDYFLQGSETVGDFLDYDGDSISDIVIGGPNTTYLHKGINGGNEYLLLDSIIMPDSLNVFWLMAGGDLNNNGSGDLMVYGNNPSTGSSNVFLYLDPFISDKNPDWRFSVDFYSHSVSSGGIVDFNGDSIKDIFLGLIADLDTLGYVYIFLGPDLSDEPDYIIAHPLGFESLDKEYFARKVFNLGDINGDGYDALGVIFDYRPFIYNCGPMVDTIYDFHLDANCSSMSNVGDINGDSYNDIGVGGSDSYYGRVVLFLGGPHMDIHRDEEITSNDLPDYFLTDIGWVLSSAGDVNNDGLDDILFTCRNWAAGSPYDVFVFSGDSGLVVDVENTDSLILPEKFKLEYNYPNPFNSSTIISFTLSYRVAAELSIYDILGRKVTTLVDGVMPAGTYQTNWDGRDDRGSIKSSGVYFYQLKTDNYTLSKKMILLK